uniref:Uncharacterized protein n=1 Tax=Ditylum brightwellii TaxID=49249 RepID=A0A7S2ERU0_9STRA|mmetsp:Transcript_4857/g.7446  ORF Transcript_4857/g.7446 Transcript_4857/m.7446 type:complete len:406 (+) Transcript_4857:458-1675(+)
MLFAVIQLTTRRLSGALIFSAPLDLVLSLIRCYPESATKLDDRAMIPLHLAFRAKEHNTEVIETLLQAFPKGVYAKDGMGRVPLDLSGGVVNSEIMMLVTQVTEGKYNGTCLAFKTTADQTSVVEQRVQDNGPRIHFPAIEERSTPTSTTAEVTNTTSTTNTLTGSLDGIETLKQEHEAEIKLLRERSNVKMDTFKNTISHELQIRTDLNENLTERLKELSNQLEEMKKTKEFYMTMTNGLRKENAEMKKMVADIFGLQRSIMQQVIKQRKDVKMSHKASDKLIRMLLDRETENMTTAIDSGDKLLALLQTSGKIMGPFVEEDLGNVDTRTSDLSSLQIRQENQGRNGKSIAFLSNSKTNLEALVEEEKESNAMMAWDQRCHFVRSINVQKVVERDDISVITSDV